MSQHQQAPPAPPGRQILTSGGGAAWVALGMALGLALIYWGRALPLVLLGLLIFGGLAALRPGFALLCVPLTVPLYLIPASIAGLRAEPFRLPLHEIALLVAAESLVLRALIDQIGRPGGVVALVPPARLVRLARAHVPELLLLGSGLIGVAIAVPEGRGAALRELRWLIVEPVIFYTLLKLHLGRDAGESDSPVTRLLPALNGFVVGGAAVALLGVLQFVGVDPVPLLGEKQAFAENIVVAGDVRRVASVYGHPNNLGLYLGRVWPIAAALALALAPAGRLRLNRWSGWYGLAALLCLLGVAVSFSRGAWLGAAVALLVLAAGVAHRSGHAGKIGARRLAWWAAGAIVLVAAVSLLLALRGTLTGGSTSTRLALWEESLGLIAAHPFGLGLDQFYYYHNPEFGRSRIAPELIGTSEQYASHPHNLVLDIWLRLGPPGLLAFGWLLVRFGRSAWRAVTAGGRSARLLAYGALSAMVAALLHGLVDQFYFVPDLALAFWLLLAAVEEAAHGESETPTG